MELTTDTQEKTFQFAFKLGEKAKAGDVFALYGDLGTGKTVIAKGIARGMGISDEITSPTFTLMELYEHPLPLYHFDLYRINRIEEFDNLGFEEYWYGHGVSVIEWADKAGDLIPARAMKIHIFFLNETKRRIIVEYTGN